MRSSVWGTDAGQSGMTRALMEWQLEARQGALETGVKLD